ncbi:glutaredoxin [Punctularia strigosozonata HHB-11173 SS5]|uniref:glutaredoxin n=1 Tax=Punctularia strigosozonata (strain HHB-11173) TaxID=741275 RepID=UPI0004417C8B|nr:glutaredoxin [Punctularia strigosozonata HHB-11173 SS5]EIN14345.1 glutaredoxin [Punctularia strigosozonata HHB-11173 SS5]
MAVKDTVESTIADNKIAIFSKSWCPYCKRAKELFRKEFPDEQPKIIELDEVADGAAIQDYLQDKTGQRSVPNIFVNQKHVGGCDDVHALYGGGKLKQLVAGTA